MRYILFIIIFSIIYGCDVFSTRTPENPDNSGASFIPPTEPAIVVQNFESSFKYKNLENYLKCFSSTTANLQNKYLFIPSQEGASSYPTVFSSWSNEEERRFFNSFKSVINNETVPLINWINKKSIVEAPDSAIFESDYNLYINFSDNSFPKQYKGKIRLVMMNDNNGLWSISKWYDYNIYQSDSIFNSISILKAILYN